MSFTFKQFHIDDKQCGMAVSTDGVLLGAWAALCLAPRILDIGAGSGLLSLMAAQRSLIDTQITAVEVDLAAANACQYNIEQSPWATKVKLLNLSIQQFRQQHLLNNIDLFDHIVCNPPYFEYGPQAIEHARSTARHTKSLSFADLQQAISQLLAPQGLASLILPQLSLTSFVKQLSRTGLTIMTQVNVASVEGKAPNRVLLALGHSATEYNNHPDRASSTNNSYQTMFIRDKQGQYSQAMADLCREFYLKL
jgi:tRNA1Val (adenine37-N6)-methyltransferase